jgi:hypothetical protein
VTGDDFIKFLYQDSFEAVDEGVSKLFDQLAVLEGVEVKKKPLDKALADLDIGIDKTIVDVDGLFVTLSDVEQYRKVHDKLFEPEVLAALSELGFVPVAGNDTAQTMEVPSFKVYFIPIGEGPEPDAKQMTDKTALKDVEKVAGQFQGDDNFKDSDKADEALVSELVDKLLKEDDEDPPSYDHEAEVEKAQKVIEILKGQGLHASYEYPGWISVPRDWDNTEDLEGFAVGTVNADWGMDHMNSEGSGTIDDEPAPLPITATAEEIAAWISGAFKKIFGKTTNGSGKLPEK